MLKNPMPIKFKGSDEVVELMDVLLVDNLPVPFHISSKHCNVLRAGASVNAWTLGVEDLTGWKDEFPSKYHSHPYWDPNSNVVYLGLDFGCAKK